jgi:proto-oncogene tyrosine-protein kinase Ret/cadherin 2 type 1 (N-cadherin)
MNYLFADKQECTGDLSKWEVQNVRTMISMFEDAHEFTSDLSKWDVQNLESMRGMFWKAHAFNSDISAWQVGKVTDMYLAFGDATQFNSDLSKWNVSSVTSFSFAFSMAGAFQQDVGDWKPMNGVATDDMFALTNSTCKFEPAGEHANGRVTNTPRFYCNDAAGLARDGAVCSASTDCDSGSCNTHCCERTPAVLIEGALCNNGGRYAHPLGFSQTWDPSTFLNQTAGWEESLITNVLVQPSGIPGGSAAAFAQQMLTVDGIKVTTDDAAAGFIFQLKWADHGISSPDALGLAVGDNPVGVQWSTASSANPGSIGIDSESGDIFAAPKTIGNYTAWLVAVNIKGTATTRGLPTELDQLLLKKWPFEVVDPPTFAVVLKDPTHRSRQIADPSKYDDPTTTTFMKGVNYKIAPLGIDTAATQVSTGTLATITYTLEGASEDWFVSATSGVIQGEFNQTGITSFSLVAVDAGGQRAVVERYTFNVRSGPNGRGCANDGTTVIDAADDTTFTCDCTGTDFDGANCEMNVRTREAEAAAAASSAAATKSKTTSTIAVGAGGGAVVLILLIVAALKYQHHRIAMRPVDFAAIFAKMVESGDISAEQLEAMASNQGKHSATFAESANLPREIPRRCITKSEKVGEGAFGEVFKGILDETSNNHGVPGYLVACKSVTDPTGDGAADLLQEATVMAQIGTHINLVSLVGVVTSGVPLLIIIALCEHGSLKGQLEKRMLGEGKLAAKPGALPPKIDADIGLEIARGMLHLVEHHLVHRDLASRNVLLDSQLVCKVADFGLSRAFSSEEGKDYYKSTSGMMALRWTAPEAMTTLKFSMKTDVWAFGIVLLEIAINGDMPIKELTNTEIMARMQSGYQTPQPIGCPDAMYEVMCKCWALDPSKRPSFLDLVDILDEGDFEGDGFAAAVAATSNSKKRQASSGGAASSESVTTAGYVVKGSGDAASGGGGLYAANPDTNGAAGASAGATAGVYAVNRDTAGGGGGAGAYIELGANATNKEDAYLAIGNQTDETTFGFGGDGASN